MPKAEASLPSARERSVSWATPAMESTIASRRYRSFSFWPLVKASSFRDLWLLPSKAIGSALASAARLRDFAEIFGNLAAFAGFAGLAFFAVLVAFGLGI